MQLQIIKKICPHCGKEFNDSKKKFCSQECYKQYLEIHKKEGKMLVCEICGNEFPYRNGRRTKTCSVECDTERKRRFYSLKEENKPLTKCKQCGKEFHYERYLKGKDVPQFCCMECYTKYRQENSEDFFKERSEKMKTESREIRYCEICGKEFEVYKKIKKRFCSQECRTKYQNTEEFREKKKQTMLNKYGSLGVAHTLSAKQVEEYNNKRKEKYQNLCDVSDMELIEYVDKHILRVRCKKCGCVFITNNLSYLPYEKITCKHCDSAYKFSKPSVKLYNFLEEHSIEFIKNDRYTIHPYEIDILIPSLNIGIEVNGNFWHSEAGGKDSKYHINKTKKCAEKGIKLIHIFEDEIEYKFDIVISRLKSVLGIIDNKIYARKCNITVLTSKEKSIFLNRTHIQGDGNSTINLGLLYDNKIVSVMTFSKERTIYKTEKDEGNYELIRFANELNTSVVGGFSKLLNYFIKTYQPKHIKTFADSRWSGIVPEMTVYEKNGFSFSRQTQPNYWYMFKNDLLTRKHRYNFTKYAIIQKHPDLDKNKTEKELMLELGYYRIWDCGNMLFEMSIT